MSINKPALAEFFEKIYIINLESRQDRRDEMQVELQKIGLSITHPNVQLFTAVRPKEKGEWPNIGARGCFMSHFLVLKDAESNGYEHILILEDDINFVKDFNAKFNEVSCILNTLKWNIFYGGYQVSDKESYLSAEQPLKTLDSKVSVMTTHFVAFNKQTISRMREYLDSMMLRQGGDSLGGPMHVDGAYSRFRSEFAETVTAIATPELGYQRSSRTDIHDLGWKDNTPVIRDIVMTLRKIKNTLMANN